MTELVPKWRVVWRWIACASIAFAMLLLVMLIRPGESFVRGTLFVVLSSLWLYLFGPWDRGSD